MDAGTLPRLFVSRALQYGTHKVGLREKDYGIWQQVTWQQYYEHVRAFCLGLVHLGLQRGDRIAVLSGNRPEWLYTELAAQALGAIPVGLFVDSLAVQVQSILQHAEARLVVVEDQEQADKVLAIRHHLPHLQHIIVDQMRGLEDYQDELLISWREVEAYGADLQSGQPLLFEELVARGGPADVALLAYTSGTTGAPKAAMLSHRNLLAMAEGVTQVDSLSDADEIVSFLPFAWVGEQLISVALALYAGATVNFPEKPETMRDDLRDIGPHVMLAPPRVWEAMCTEHQVKIAEAGFLKRKATELALAIGLHRAERELTQRSSSGFDRVLDGLAYLLAFRSLRDKFGLTRVRVA
jgi:long-chain acyl-CoA synthetase